jgi:hypothetical protein
VWAGRNRSLLKTLLVIGIAAALSALLANSAEGNLRWKCTPWNTAAPSWLPCLGLLAAAIVTSAFSIMHPLEFTAASG